MSIEFYSAQMCVNGHALDAGLEERELPACGQQNPFCSLCGADTIIACQKCNAPIRGEKAIVLISGSVFLDEHIEQRQPSGRFVRAAYCHNCGTPYPWTEKVLEAARELIDETEDYPDTDKDKLKQSLPDLIAERPGTIVAKSRLEKLRKAAPVVAKGLWDLLRPIATEEIKKGLSGLFM